MNTNQILNLFKPARSVNGVEWVNLCSGGQRVEGYFSIDIDRRADRVMDLSSGPLPFRSDSVSGLFCSSAINYFFHDRAKEIVREVYRVLKPGGVARFSSQDLELFARNYLEKNRVFYDEKLADGRDRYAGRTLGEKFVAYLYGGYAVSNAHACRYFYDFETLALLFKDAGFRTIERKKYRESALSRIEEIDNRPDQVFYLEATK